MAQLNITLNQDEILQLLSSNREDAFKSLLTECLNGVLQAESTAQLGAEPYERSATRSGSRNGTRERQLNTRIGTITLAVPRHREKPFHTLVFENYSRSEAALVTTMAEMVVNGVSTRKVATVMETLCGTSFSKSTVSEACKNLDKAVKDFKYRPLEDRYEFMYVDATYFKVRGEHRIGSKAMMVALALTKTGKREIVGFETYDNESKETWISSPEAGSFTSNQNESKDTSGVMVRASGVIGARLDVRRYKNEGWFADPFILDVTKREIIVLVEEWYDSIQRGRISKLTIGVLYVFFIILNLDIKRIRK